MKTIKKDEILSIINKLNNLDETDLEMIASFIKYLKKKESKNE